MGDRTGWRQDKRGAGQKGDSQGRQMGNRTGKWETLQGECRKRCMQDKIYVRQDAPTLLEKQSKFPRYIT